jgi:hypothetical protein
VAVGQHGRGQKKPQPTNGWSLNDTKIYGYKSNLNSAAIVETVKKNSPPSLKSASILDVIVFRRNSFHDLISFSKPGEPAQALQFHR